MRKYLTSILLFTSVISFAQTTHKIDKDKDRIDSVCDSFMKTFELGQIHEGMQLLKQNTVLSPSQIDTLESKINYQFLFVLPTSYGKILSSEL
jgi:hypothetical protein